MEKRVKSNLGVQMKKLRQSTVEPVIGTLVNYMGLSRINAKGLSNATKCMTMSAIAYNLKKLIKSFKISNLNRGQRIVSSILIDLMLIYNINFEQTSFLKISTELKSDRIL